MSDLLLERGSNDVRSAVQQLAEEGVGLEGALVERSKVGGLEMAEVVGEKKLGLADDGGSKQLPTPPPCG